MIRNPFTNTKIYGNITIQRIEDTENVLEASVDGEPIARFNGKDLDLSEGEVINEEHLVKAAHLLIVAAQSGHIDEPAKTKIINSKLSVYSAVDRLSPGVNPIYDRDLEDDGRSFKRTEAAHGEE